MGCKQTKHSRVKHNGQLYNEDVDKRKKFLTGIHIAKGANGIEGNIQLAFGTARRKKYELVTPAMTEEEKQTVESHCVPSEPANTQVNPSDPSVSWDKEYTK